MKMLVKIKFEKLEIWQNTAIFKNPESASAF